MSLGDGPGLSGGKLTATSLADVESIPIARHVDQLAFNNAKTFLASKATDSYKSGHQQKIQALSWNCEGKKLATASLDHSVKIWELENSGLRHKTTIPKAHAQAVQLLCWSKENPDLFITTAWDGQVIQWDARMDAKKRHVNKVASVVTKGENINMAWSPDGNIIAVGSKKDDISIIDARKFSDKSAIRSWSFRGLVEINEIAFSRDSNYILLAGSNGQVQIHNTNELKLEYAVESHTGSCTCMQFDSKYEYLVTGGTDGRVNIWTTNDLCCIQSIPSFEYPIRALGVSHDGMYIAAGSEAPYIDIIHTRSGQSAHRLAMKGGTTALAWNPSRTILAYSSDEKDREGRPGILNLFGLRSAPVVSAAKPQQQQQQQSRRPLSLGSASSSNSSKYSKK